MRYDQNSIVGLVITKIKRKRVSTGERYLGPLVGFGGR
jgi:hypothetical protein